MREEVCIDGKSAQGTAELGGDAGVKLEPQEWLTVYSHGSFSRTRRDRKDPSVPSSATFKEGDSTPHLMLEVLFWSLQQSYDMFQHVNVHRVSSIKKRFSQFGVENLDLSFVESRLYHQHQCWSSVMLLCLNGSKSLHPGSTSGEPETRRVEAVWAADSVTITSFTYGCDVWCVLILLAMSYVQSWHFVLRLTLQEAFILCGVWIRSVNIMPICQLVFAISCKQMKALSWWWHYRNGQKCHQHH